MATTELVPLTHGYINYLSSIIKESQGQTKNVSADELYASVKVPIYNMRQVPELNLWKNGFQLVHHESKVKDFWDPEQTRKIYRKEVAALAKLLTGCDKVYVGAHLLRSEKAQEGEGERDLSGAAPDEHSQDLRKHVQGTRAHHVVHNDYYKGFREFLDELPPRALKGFFQAPSKEDMDEVKESLVKAKRLVYLNMWRPILETPLEHCPLALCRTDSVDDRDFVGVPLTEYNSIPLPSNKFKIAMSYPNAAHKWFFAPQQVRDEVLVFKTYDSMKETQFPLHTAFLDPNTPKDAPKRESIEIRVACLYFESTPYPDAPSVDSTASKL